MNWIIIFSLTLLAILAFAVYKMTQTEQDMDELMQYDEAHLLAELATGTTVLWVCFAGGFLLTVNYAVTYFSGSDIRLMSEWTHVQWSGAFIGVVVTGAITAIQMVLYRATTNHKAGLLVTALILIFVIISEVSSPMEKEAMKVNERSINSSTYQAVVSSISNVRSTPSAYTGELASAKAKLAEHEYELGRCDRHAPKGQKRIDRCVNYEKKKMAHYQGIINGLNAQANVEADNNKAMSLEMVKAAERLENNEAHHSAIVRFVKTLFDAPAIGAMALLSLILVTAFEAGFHFAGTRVGLIKAALMRKGNQDIVLGTQYKREKKAAKFRQKTDKMRQQYGDLPPAVATAHTPSAPDGNYTNNNIGFLAGGYPPANPARRVTQGTDTQGQNNPVHRVAQGTDTQGTQGANTQGQNNPARRVTQGSDTQGQNNPARRVTQGSDTQGQKAPVAKAKTPAFYKDKADQQQRIAEMVDKTLQQQQTSRETPVEQAKSAPVTTSTPTTAKKPAMVAKITRPSQPETNPVHRVTQGQPTQGQANPVHRVTQGSQKGGDTQGSSPIKNGNSLYSDWKKAIAAQEIKPTVTQSRKWLQKRISNTQSKKLTHTPKEIAKMIDIFFLKAVKDRVVIINPNYRNGLPKYLIA